MALQFHPHLAAAERRDELSDEAADAMLLSLECRPARERDEPVGLADEIFELQIELALRRLQLGARDDATELLVAFGGLHQHGQRPGFRRACRALRDFRIG